MIPLFAALAGVLTWSFLEYVIHRFAGHDPRLVRNLFGREHTAHHRDGGYFAPWWKKAVAAVIVTALLTPPAAMLLGTQAGLAYALGFVGFYLTYELIHRLEHAWGGVGPYARWARRHHFYHHFHNPKANHGVTSPLWDVVFGTYVRPEGHILVPRELAMRWLCDEGGEVLPQHAERYAIKTSRRRRIA